jgi:hypothetical protein
MNSMSYCVKCRKHTPSVNPVQSITKSGRHMVKSKCVGCGINKSKFVSSVLHVKVKAHRKGGNVLSFLSSLI